MPRDLHGPGDVRLALRGSDRRLWSDLYRPDLGRAVPLLVFFPASSNPVVDPVTLCHDTGVAVLVTCPVTTAEAVSVLGWSAEHARELGCDPSRLLVGGERSGAVLAGSVAEHARDEGWPPVHGQLLVDPGVATDHRGAVVIAVADAQPARLSAALRDAVHHPDLG